MRIEITKPSGRARCFICLKLIAVNEIQLKVHTFKAFPKSMHGSCVQEILDHAATKHYGSKSKTCIECNRPIS